MHLPVLSMYSPHAETEIHYDASIDEFCAVLIKQSVADNQFYTLYYMSNQLNSNIQVMNRSYGDC